MDVRDGRVLVLAHEVDGVDDLCKLLAVDHVVGLKLSAVDYKCHECRAFDLLDYRSGIDRRCEHEVTFDCRAAGVDDSELHIAVTRRSGVGYGVVTACGGFLAHLDGGAVHPGLEVNELLVLCVFLGACAVHFGAGGIELGVSHVPVVAVASGYYYGAEFEAVGSVFADNHGGEHHFAVARQVHVSHVEIDCDGDRT